MMWFKKIFVVFLLVSVCAPPLLLSAPQPAHAIFGIGDINFDPTNWIQNSIAAAATVLEKVSLYALQIKAYVLDPLSFILSGNALKAVTGGVVNFINGQGNGTGAKQFVQNLQQHLLTTGDTQAFSFFAEFGKNSNSPFGATILSALHTNYLQGTSAAGFWAANQCTLNQLSSNPLAFVGGDFSKGGWSAWFGLTTQPQNNPYTLYYRAQSESAARIQAAQQVQSQQLAWGQGLLSWCGDQGSDTTGAGFSCPAGMVWNSSFGQCTTQSVADSTQDTCAPGEVYNASFKTCTTASVAAATNSNCTKKDGTPGDIQTPGSVIHDALQKTLGSDVDKLVGVGTSGEVSSIFQSISGIMSTVAYGASLFGGGQGGLSALGQTHALSGSGYLGTTASALQQSQQAVVAANQQQGQSNYQQQQQGATQTVADIRATPPATINVVVNAVTGAVTTTTGGSAGTTGSTGSTGGTTSTGTGFLPAGTDVSTALLTRANQYQAAWNTIGAAAVTAQTNINTLAGACTPAWQPDIQHALTFEIQPVLTKFNAMPALVGSAQTAAQQAQAKANAGTFTQADFAALLNVSPTVAEVAQAQVDASGSPSATAKCALYGFTTIGGTILSQMNLIVSNAAISNSFCTNPFFDTSACTP